ncbi:hypothetical protein F4826_002980 [Rahnella inusitata]|nr:hypothetical protein [Rahnella inusitata]
MTDTTDTKALRTLSMQRVKEIANGDSMLMGERVDLANTAIRFHKELDVALDAFKNAATELFSAQEQLEAERQRADNWSVSFENERLRADKLAAHIEALKGEQVPVAYCQTTRDKIKHVAMQALSHALKNKQLEMADIHALTMMLMPLFTAPQKPVEHPDTKRMDWLCAHTVQVRDPMFYGSHAMFWSQWDSDDCEEHHTKLREQVDAAIEAAGGLSIPQATIEAAPQKPVISKEKLCDWLEDNFDIDDSQRAAFAACFAHCCDCIVQSSSAPVGEIVAWAGTDREKGITREVDFRFLRFDVLPGTKLYAVEPEPAAKSDLLTRAQALAVETRALACRIKAGD